MAASRRRGPSQMCWDTATGPAARAAATHFPLLQAHRIRRMKEKLSPEALTRSQGAWECSISKSICHPSQRCSWSHLYKWLEVSLNLSFKIIAWLPFQNSPSLMVTTLCLSFVQIPHSFWAKQCKVLWLSPPNHQSGMWLEAQLQ